MRRVLSVTAVALVATLALSGCGSKPAATTASTAPAAGSAAPAAQAAAAPAAVASRSDATSETNVPLGSLADLPDDLRAALGAGTPCIIYFYSSSASVTDDLRDQIDRVVSDSEGGVVLFAYDMTKYATVGADGKITLETTAIEADSAGKQQLAFAKAVGVDNIPFTLVVNSDGVAIFRARGYVDATLLGREADRAVR